MQASEVDAAVGSAIEAEVEVQIEVPKHGIARQVDAARPPLADQLAVFRWSTRRHPRIVVGKDRVEVPTIEPLAVEEQLPAGGRLGVGRPVELGRGQARFRRRVPALGLFRFGVFLAVVLHAAREPGRRGET